VPGGTGDLLQISNLQQIEDQIKQVKKCNKKDDETENFGSDKISAYGKHFFHKLFMVKRGIGNGRRPDENLF
jgi:hypothetical protein